jgi:hypothetical protein
MGVNASVNVAKRAVIASVMVMDDAVGEAMASPVRWRRRCLAWV